jgi:hypothetical protein
VIPGWQQELDVTALMKTIEAGGAKMALALAVLEVEVPSTQIPARFGPKLMPFGKVFFQKSRRRGAVC